jgi:ATP-dependent Lon protease
MDIDQNGRIVTEPGRQIILPKDVLPNVVHVLPQEHRPVFPGQVFPVILETRAWAETLKAIHERQQDVVGLIAGREKFEGLPRPEQLFEMGTVCRIHRVHAGEQEIHVLLEGLQRFRVRSWVRAEAPYLASVQYFPERGGELGDAADRDELKAYAVAIINTIKELIPLNPLYGEELKVFLGRSNPNEPALLADFAAGLTTASKQELQDVLETIPLAPRLAKVLKLLQQEVRIARTQMEIRTHVEGEMQKHQREALLRQQLKYIQKELGLTKEDKAAEIEEFRRRLEGKAPPDAVRGRIEDELRKLSLLEQGSPEFGVTRNYLDWLTSLPWGVVSQDTTDLAAATRVLESHHEGLADVKERIEEFLALGIKRGEAAGTILLLVGPPGVGKTSLGRAVADALGRRFFRFSVGGMRDEAEIKGHRRTYIGALPGKIASALKDCAVANPVILLDEVDKIGASFQGDPASALLEVLDPEQNGRFRDHYLDVELDLSRVLFVCTANQLDTIPPPLLDRMEVIHLSGYLAAEKRGIARKHLLPRLTARAGLAPGELKIDAGALRHIVDGYSREAGVRQLEKQLARVVRKAVVKRLGGAPAPITVGRDDVADYLGKPRYVDEPKRRGVGVVTGLAWTPMGGATLSVEAVRVHGQRSGFQITGQLGDVMKESATIALDYVRANAASFGADPEFFDDAFLHLHVPAGATPKDGPSAGITMAAALLSLARGRAPKSGLAMTGELTLTGAVYAVGGIREKLLAAKRAGIREVILPGANRRDLDDVAEEIRRGLQIRFVDTFAEVTALLGLR